MRVWHAVALALVGWYLMIPPFGAREPDLRAPPYQWFYADWDPEKVRPTERYLTLAECEAQKVKRLKDSIDRNPYLRDARCVKSDDFRLKPSFYR
jgi:hypothetical protein